MNSEAVTSPPVPREAMARSALVYYHSMGLADWNFGAGHLFDFTYLDPELKERGVTDEERVKLDIASDWLAAPNGYYFAWRDAKWRDETVGYRTVALAAVQQALAQCVAASGCDEVLGRLKPIVERHPELQVLQKQLDCISVPKDQAASDCPTVLSQTQP
jgi:hypothetical protein